MLQTLFQLSRQGTNVRTEIIAGITTYLTMAYVIFVNPDILAQAGMDRDAVFVATCLAAAIGSLIMGLWANLPIAQAPGMGLNAFFTYGVVLGSGHTWQVALGAVFLSGVVFLILNFFKFRQWVIGAIPMTLRKAIAAGIGTFMALIALKNAGIVVSNPDTMVSLGDLSQVGPILSAVGFFMILWLSSKNVIGAVMISILTVTALGLAFGVVDFNGIFAAPPSIAPVFMQMDILGALDVAMLSVIFAFLFVDLFDTSGTLIAVSERAGLSKNGEVPNLNRALSSDSIATISGAALGTSTTTSYIESASGVSAGGRTGLTAVVVGILFLLSIFIAPLAGMIPSYATTGAIFYVSVLMMFALKDVDWNDLTEATPVAVVILLTPLTFSIANGIAFGFISYALAKGVSGKSKQVSAAVWVLSVVFALKFILLD